ncbi:MAG: peptide-methionine (S)-S-oxide reductase MsrA [Proteobacteria bacterium]|nr:peptide-methionine (S)-S-oxide reductase MsrA [Pseudomonadota bacterium]
MLNRLFKSFSRTLRALPAAGLACGISCSQAASLPLPDPAVDPPPAAHTQNQTIVLAGGCFWGIQAVFQHVRGVSEAISGYAGGDAKTAAYDAVSSGTTGHAEAVKVTYDPAQITLGQLLKVYFSVAHNPTELNRQGPDRGTQYRSGIFFTTPEQEKVATAYIDQLQKAGIFSAPIVTEVKPLPAFYPAEDYHQNYATKHPVNPYIVINDLPKVVDLKNQFPSLYTDQVQ